MAYEMMIQGSSSMDSNQDEQSPHGVSVNIAGKQAPFGLTRCECGERDDSEQAHRHTVRGRRGPAQKGTHQQDGVEEAVCGERQRSFPVR